VALLFAAVPAAGRGSSSIGLDAGLRGTALTPMGSRVRIAYLHHSTGEVVWSGGVPAFIEAWNGTHGTDYRITEVSYPATTGGWPPVIRRLARTYPWANYPYDYWNLWVKHTGSSRDRGELNLDDLVKTYDVIVFKHCFPVSRVQPDGKSPPRVSSQEKTLANYKLQYEAIKARFRQFPEKRFIAWTGAALPEPSTTEAEAARAREFFEWVKGSWDEKGDNIFVWDFHELETEGGLYLKAGHAASVKDAHPSSSFARRVAPLIGRRIVDVIEGRGDSGSLTGWLQAPGDSSSDAHGWDGSSR
jgi:hypothetical protein